MAKVLFVSEAPKNLKANELVINPPNFLNEIHMSKAKGTGKKVTSLHHMRQILMLIGNTYDPEGTFNSYTSIPLTRFEGLPFETDEDLNQIVIRMLNKHYPVMLDKVIEYNLKKRSQKVDTIYFTGDKDKAQLFIKNGIDIGDLSDVSQKESKKKAKDTV